MAVGRCPIFVPQVRTDILGLKRVIVLIMISEMSREFVIRASCSANTPEPKPALIPWSPPAERSRSEAGLRLGISN